jgi:hypothetical protein
MDLACVYMSQVVVGPMDRYAFYSGQFSSCSPLFVFNKVTKWGGYYHLPGRHGEGLEDSDKTICEALIHAVKPTTAYVFHPGEFKDPTKSYDPFTAAAMHDSDADHMKALLSQIAAARSIRLDVQATGASMISLLAYLQGGALRFTADANRAGPYGKVYCSKRGTRPPGCGVKNWNVDTKNFVLLASGVGTI